MYVLVYFGVLRDDKPVQLAYENRIVPLPDVWRRQSDTYTDANSDAHSDTYANSDANSDAYTQPGAQCAEQSRGDGSVNDSDQLVVDG